MTPEQKLMEGLSWALASRDILVSEEGLVIIRDAIREAEAAARADERGAFPLGALVNGRELMRRLTDYYAFECEGGLLENCVEWHDLERCFTAFEEYAAARTEQQEAAE